MQRVFPPAYRAIRALLTFPLLWLIGFLLVAWGLRLYHLGWMSIWWDESLSWDRALQDLPTILSNTIHIQNVVTHDLHPPMYFVLLHFAVLLVGTTEFGLRVLSTFANLLTLALFYPFARLLFGARGKMIGMLAVLFGTISPFYVWYSQEARPYALVLLWSTLTLYALIRWLKLPHPSLSGGLSRWLIIFVLALGATLATHYLSFVLLPFLALTILLFGDRGLTPRARLRSPLTLIALALLGAFIAIFVFIPNGAEQLTGSDYGSAQFVPFFIMLRDVWHSFSIGVTASLDEGALLDLFLVVLWLAGIFSLVHVKSSDARLALFLFSYLILPAVALQLGSYLRPLYLNSRHLITTSPAFYLGIAVGVEALARRIADVGRTTGDGWRSFSVIRRPSSVVFLAVTFVAVIPLLIGSNLSLNNLYYNTAYAKDDHKDWSQFLQQRLRPDDYLLLVAPQAEKIVQYYAPPGLQWQSLPNLGQSRDSQEYLDRQAVLQAYRNHGRVWFLELHAPVADPKMHITDLMQRWGEPIDRVYFPGISTQIVLSQYVYHSPLQDDDVKIPKPLLIVFDQNLHFLGYDAPQEFAAGQRVAMSLYWRLNHKMPDDLLVSLRVVDDKGTVWGQWDAPPVGNLYPIPQWLSRAIMLDEHDLVVDPGAPPGDYAVELSVSRSTGHEPLSYRIGSAPATTDPIHLTTIHVTHPNPPTSPRDLLMDGHADMPFDDAVRFVGYDSEEMNPNPGSVIPLTLYFQVAQAAGRTLSGHIELAPPWWQFWNPTRASIPFTLDLTLFRSGDLAQVRMGALVPGDAAAGAYDLSVALDGFAPQTIVPASAFGFGTVNVEPLTRSTDLPPIQHPLQARLGDSVQFLGYGLDGTPPLHAGDHVKLTLYWRALKTMDTSYKVFTHLLGSDNKIVGQSDALPLNGARPTTSWAPGEIFADTYEFDVDASAPAGTYQIEIGMYNAETSVRLPTFDAQGNPAGDRLLLEELPLQ